MLVANNNRIPIFYKSLQIPIRGSLMSILPGPCLYPSWPFLSITAIRAVQIPPKNYGRANPSYHLPSSIFHLLCWSYRIICRPGYKCSSSNPYIHYNHLLDPPTEAYHLYCACVIAAAYFFAPRGGAFCGFGLSLFVIK